MWTWILNKWSHTQRIFQIYKRLQQNGCLSSISGLRESDNNSVHLGLEPDPWLSQRFIAGLIWLYRVYRRLREKHQRENEMECLMKEIYFGLRFDNLYSIFTPMSSARLCRCCVLLFFFSHWSFIISFQSVPPAFCDGAEIKYWAPSL